jgi:hypothetical protein
MSSETKRGEKVIGVLLTEQAWADLELVLAPYTLKGRTIDKFIYARKVDPDGPYFTITASRTNSDGTSFEAEISVPHHYVKVFISASDKAQLGFGAEA